MTGQTITRALGTISQALDALRAGRPVLVTDAANRENEADVVLAAARATPEWVAWTIRHTSGLLCAPMTTERADALGLPPMVEDNQDPRQTAYTVTVDAARGVGTGISAADRTLTVRVLGNPAAVPTDLNRPGHVLPLRAVPGGVLERPGHTEAAVDLCRLAGLPEVGVIAELVHDDGTMMGLDDALALGAEYDLVTVTIADLAAWRRVHDTDLVLPAPVPQQRVERTGEAALPSELGEFRILGYRDLLTGDEHAVLVNGKPPERGALVRVHSECLTGDAFVSLRCDCGPQLHAALRAIAVEGGVVVYLRGHEGRGIGLLSKISAYALQDVGRNTVEANLDLGLPADRREYGAAAAILEDLGLHGIRLLTNNPAKVTGLLEHGVEVDDRVPLEVTATIYNAAYLETKVREMGHLIGHGAGVASTTPTRRCEQ